LPCCWCPLVATTARAACTAYGLKSHTMTGVGAPSSIVTECWPAVVVIQHINAGSSSNHHVTETPHTSQGTCMGVVFGVMQKGGHVCCTAGMCTSSAQRCMMNMNMYILRMQVCWCMPWVNRWNMTMASSALSWNGQLNGLVMPNMTALCLLWDFTMLIPSLCTSDFGSIYF